MWYTAICSYCCSQINISFKLAWYKFQSSIRYGLNWEILASYHLIFEIQNHHGHRSWIGIQLIPVCFCYAWPCSNRKQPIIDMNKKLKS